MRKRITILVALMLLISVFPASVKAGAAQYGITQSFLDYLDENGISYVYGGINDDGLEAVDILYKTSNYDPIETNWQFDDEFDRVAVRVYYIIHYQPENLLYVLDAVNKLNSSYRYFRFFTDETDNTVTMAYDMPLDEAASGELCADILARVVDVVDEAYNVLGKYDKG